MWRLRIVDTHVLSDYGQISRTPCEFKKMHLVAFFIRNIDFYVTDLYFDLALIWTDVDSQFVNQSKRFNLSKSY